MVDPNVAAPIQGYSISAPDVLWVELGDVDVLDNHVGHIADESQALAANDTCVTHADDALVRSHVDGSSSRIIVGDFDRWVVSTPIVGVDGELAGRCSAPRRATGLGGRAFGASEIELLVQDDRECLIRLEI